MRRILSVVVLIIMWCSPLQAAILVLSPNGGAPTTKSTLSAAATDADVAGKTVVVTSALSAVQSNISSATLHGWPTDRSLRVETGGSIGNTTTLRLYNTPQAGRYRIFSGSGRIDLSLSAVSTVFPEWWGAVVNDSASGVKTANSSAWAAMLSAFSNTAYPESFGPIIQYGVGSYYYATGVRINRSVTVQGAGAGGDPSSTKLIFNDGETGFTVDRYNTSADGGRGDDTVIRDMSIRGAAKTVTGGHGIFMKARARLYNLEIQGFSGDGVHIVSTGSPTGNANNWFAENVISIANGNNGFYIAGSDANAGTAIAISAMSNAYWGVKDESFLGNTYVGAHTEGNTLGGYTATGAAAKNLFLGCYTEGGQPDNDFTASPKTIIISGTHGVANLGALEIQGDTDGLHMPVPMVWNTTSGTILRFGINRGSSQNDVLQFGVAADTASTQHYRLKYTSSGGDVGMWKLWYGTSNTPLGFTGTAYAGGAGKLAFPEGFIMGSVSDSAFRKQVYASAMPSTGSWTQGDFVWNSAPSVGTPTLGWMRVTTGSNNVLNTDWVAK